MLDSAFAVIMAGGKGERFWPLSTSKRPKQVLALVGGKPLIQIAVERLEGVIPPERVIVITSQDLVAVTKEAAPQLPAGNIIGEPFGRDTAAACALASAIVGNRCPGGVFCILTADHIMGDLDTFRQTLSEGLTLASERDILITIGINPSFPSTGYGYIETAEAIETGSKIEFRRALRFVEKPERERAEEYLATGRYFWNSGMFMWSVSAFQKALERFTPDLLVMAKRMGPLDRTDAFDTALAEEYDKLDRISVDYAIMEKSDNIVMARGTFQWSDVGSWPALEEHFPHDDDDNVLIGQCEALDSMGNIVLSAERLTALIGVQNLVVVQAEGATLVCTRDAAQNVKDMVKHLRDSGEYADLL